MRWRGLFPAKLKSKQGLGADLNRIYLLLSQGDPTNSLVHSLTHPMPPQGLNSLTQHTARTAKVHTHKPALVCVVVCVCVYSRHTPINNLLSPCTLIFLSRCFY